MKESFRSFKQLKVLKLSSNKLFMDDQRRSEHLRDLLYYVGGTLEELFLNENLMKNEDF